MSNRIRPVARRGWPFGSGSRRRPRPAVRPTLEVMEVRTMLSTIVVNTLADPATPTPGVISLREAIAQAASNSGDQTISFASYLSGPVELA